MTHRLLTMSAREIRREARNSVPVLWGSAKRPQFGGQGDISLARQKFIVARIAAGFAQMARAADAMTVPAAQVAKQVQFLGKSLNPPTKSSSIPTEPVP